MPLLPDFGNSSIGATTATVTSPKSSCESGPAFAHTEPAFPGDISKWEPLFTPGCPALAGNDCKACRNLDRNHGHLNKVAFWTAKFAEEMFPPNDREARDSARHWGYLAGLWHDVGKFSHEFQAYLRTATDLADPHQAEVEIGRIGKVDHSTAGAKRANGIQPFGALLAYLIAGHHTGLQDAVHVFQSRLKKDLPRWEEQADAAGLPRTATVPRPPETSAELGMPGLAFLLRMLFSSLVDADFLATEAFMSRERAVLRKRWPAEILPRMTEALDAHFAKAFGVSTDPVSTAREGVRSACQQAAHGVPGFFSLSVPTGGGKTLSSLAFALRHAVAHGLQRVIYVIPYTSIIEQNAEVFREAFAPLSHELGSEIVLEHHSNLEPKHESVRSRLAAENWDAPLVVTTNVQLFQSLYASRTSRCRKLHNIANAVIILDEAQSLPARLLTPILSALRSLVQDFGSTVLLCTATQPALEKRDDFTIGIPGEAIREIIPDRVTLFKNLERVKTRHLGNVSDDALLTQVLARADRGSLLIVNTTKAARELRAKLVPRVHVLHLSARMCPAHRGHVLAKIKALHHERAVVVSTQVIEAGVDISFPVVFRAECGLDSFAQSAGRCNRHGELGIGPDAGGEVFFFEPAEHPIPRQLSDLAEAAGITRAHIIGLFAEEKFLSLEAIRAFFEQSIWQAGPRTNQWDQSKVLSFLAGGTGSHPFEALAFESAAAAFQLIPQKTRPVIIPWGAEGEALADELRLLEKQQRPPNRSHHRRAQRFTVQIYEHEWASLSNRIELLHDSAFPLLIHPKNDYDSATGLKPPDTADRPDAFIFG